MSSITDLIISQTLVMVLAVWLTQSTVSVAPVLRLAVTVLLAATGVGHIVTDRSRVGTVESTVMATCTLLSS